MLEAVHELRDSLSDEQWEKARKKLTEEMVNALKAAFDSTSEEEVKEHVATFTALMKRKPLKALGLYRALNPEQKELIMSLMEE